MSLILYDFISLFVANVRMVDSQDRGLCAEAKSHPTYFSVHLTLVLNWINQLHYWFFVRLCMNAYEIVGDIYERHQAMPPRARPDRC